MKKGKTFVLLLAAMGLITACTTSTVDPNPSNPPEEGDKEGDKTGDNVVHVTGVEFEVEELELTAGDIEEIAYEISPKNATNKNVTLTSSNENVATISQKGVIRALSAGETTLVVTSEDGNKVGEALLTVYPNPDEEEEIQAVSAEKDGRGSGFGSINKEAYSGF